MRKTVVILMSLGSFYFSLAKNTIVNNKITDNYVIKTHNEGFKQIAVTQLPELLLNTLKKEIVDLRINQAYINESSQFKLNVTMNGKDAILYANELGQWIEK